MEPYYIEVKTPEQEDFTIFQEFKTYREAKNEYESYISYNRHNIIKKIARLVKIDESGYFTIKKTNENEFKKIGYKYIFVGEN